MIVEYIRYRVDAARAAAFLSAYETGAATLEADARCLSYEVSQGHEEPDRFVVRIEWTSLDDHLQGFRQSPEFGRFFSAVRPFFDDIEEMKHYEVHRAFTRLEPDEPTLFDWAGGAPAFERLIEAFYDRVEGDDLLSGLFPGGVTREHRESVTLWWSEVFGGPARYSEMGGYPRMLSHHRNLGITADQRFRFASLMSQAADDAGLPDDPEFRAAFVGYVEWGTRLALANSQPGADVVTAAPVPRWGWGVAPPYQP
ncbi:MAG: antibiotic biosynthesis monooxygenase [Propionibacteriaceae bacterium]